MAICKIQDESADAPRPCRKRARRHASLRLQAFAQARWQRNARVQARAVRNGQIFHATGVTRVGRDIGLRLMGARLMDVPWLYGYGRS